MTINERVKYFRKNILRISQEKFASALGMKQTGVSYMEREGSTVTDQTIKTICLNYHVSENWLRNGQEPVFYQSNPSSLDEYAKRHGATALELQIVKAYFELDPDTRSMLLELLQRLKNNFTDSFFDVIISPKGKTIEAQKNAQNTNFTVLKSSEKSEREADNFTAKLEALERENEQTRRENAELRQRLEAMGQEDGLLNACDYSDYSDAG